jgi:hypothetical protein
MMRKTCRGISRARMTLGQMYEEGRGVKQDLNKAIEYYKSSSEEYARKRLDILIKTHEIYKKNTECPICTEKFDDVNNNFCSTPCHHIFHTSCLLKALKEKNTCPICRNILLEEPLDVDEPPPLIPLFEEEYFPAEIHLDNDSEVDITPPHIPDNEYLIDDLIEPFSDDLAVIGHNIGEPDFYDSQVETEIFTRGERRILLRTIRTTRTTTTTEMY